MARKLSHLSVPFAVIAAVATFSACSKDTSSGTSSAGGAAGTAGVAGALPTGGAAGSSGTVGSGGMTANGGAMSSGGSGTGGAAGADTGGSAGATMGMDAGILGYVCEEKLKMIDPGGTAMAGASCCGGAGKCTLASALPESQKGPLFGHDTCAKTADANDLRCAPVPAGDAAAGAEGLYASCSAMIGPSSFEGRCVPKCFLEGDPNVNTLTAGSCKAGSLDLLCAPCYNPVDAKATGACSLAPNDKPKMPAPTPYAKCGGGDGAPALGTCVPKTIALASGNPAAPSLKQDDCSSADFVCTPTLKAQDVNSCFVKCLTGLNQGYVDGACVPVYVATDVSPSALAFIKQTSCPTGEVCAPCQDLLSPGNPSHACQ
jgi:hypothetical protein